MRAAAPGSGCAGARSTALERVWRDSGSGGTMCGVRVGRKISSNCRPRCRSALRRDWLQLPVLLAMELSSPESLQGGLLNVCSWHTLRLYLAQARLRWCKLHTLQRGRAGLFPRPTRRQSMHRSSRNHSERRAQGTKHTTTIACRPGLLVLALPPLLYPPVPVQRVATLVRREC
jgi:hypothetical protein